MADKEATVYIIDVGHSMGASHNGRDENDLDYGMRYVWDKITTTLLAGRITWTVGVIGLRTDVTETADAALNQDESYSHISVLQPLGPMKMRDLRALQTVIKPSETESGDAISAIVVAISSIMKYTTNAKGAPLKYTRKIVLVTNGRGTMDSDDLEEVAKKLNEDGIQLTAM
jgi:ATP-dependent DNA helicase 2 subunit 2